MGSVASDQFPATKRAPGSVRNADMFFSRTSMVKPDNHEISLLLNSLLTSDICSAAQSWFLPVHWTSTLAAAIVHVAQEIRMSATIFF